MRATSDDSPAPASLVGVVCADPLVRRLLCELVSAEGLAHAGASEPGAVSPAAELLLWDLGAQAPSSQALQDLGRSATPVLALVRDGESAREALAHGARGALGREAPPAALGAALRAALAGLTVLDAPASRAVLEALAPEAEPAEEPLAPALTARETEVLGLLAEGLSNKLIAARLGISERTVKFHVNGLLARLGAQSRTEAVVRAARGGLLTL